MPNHYQPVSLSHGENTQRLCSYIPPKKLIVFVHGFNGSATATWEELPAIVQENQKFKDADIIFFGYDSLKTQANNMRLTLYDLIAEEANPPLLIGSSDRKLPKGHQYEKIVFVAHSLGAVVTRLMLLYAYDDNAPWLDKCRMVLYAPAHHGSRVLDNFKECFLGASVLFKSFGVTKYPILIDLQENSRVLKNLKERTLSILQSGKGDFTKAVSVVWAANENIVINDRFCDDTLEKQIAGTTHTSVCKPTAANKYKPLEFLLKSL